MYKNLPSEERESLIFKRKLLDGLAALFFALKFQFNLIPEILKAHREFDKIKSQFPHTPNTQPLSKLLGTIPNSIVFGYFFQGKKTWKKWVD